MQTNNRLGGKKFQKGAGNLKDSGFHSLAVIIVIVVIAFSMGLLSSGCSNTPSGGEGALIQLQLLYKDLNDTYYKTSRIIDANGGIASGAKISDLKSIIDEIKKTDDKVKPYLADSPKTKQGVVYKDARIEEAAKWIHKLALLRNGLLEFAFATSEKIDFDGPVPDGVRVLDNKWPYRIEEKGAQVQSVMPYKYFNDSLEEARENIIGVLF